MDNRKYSILIIALGCHYSHLNRFIYHLKKENPIADITLFGDVFEEDLPDEIKKSVHEYIGREHCRFRVPSMIRKLVNKIILVKQFRRLCSKYHFDIVNIHFVQYYLLFVMRYLKKMSSKVVVTPWGSDVLRVGERQTFFLKCLFRKVDYVSANPSGNVGKVISGKFGFPSKKMQSLVWGSETIDCINDNKDVVSVDEAKARFGIGDCYVITCGYNAFREQRHDWIIESVAKIKGQLPKNTTLLFPVTYGNSDKNEYINILKQKCGKYNLNSVFVENYLSVKDVFMLRMATDLFIHVQTTDASCATIQEYALCNKKIIHGSWIHYLWSDYQPLFYFPVDNLEDLPETIIGAIKSDNIEMSTEMLSIMESAGWNRQIKNWNDFFISCIKE